MIDNSGEAERVEQEKNSREEKNGCDCSRLTQSTHREYSSDARQIGGRRFGGGGEGKF
jgi:hypothetical protein